jgi:biopolymer transport protein ExbD
MAFYFSRRKLKPKEHEEMGELNIVPYLDILMNLIIFLLMSITGLATFGILNVNAPNYGGPSAGVSDTPDKPQQILTVLISKKGFYIAGSEAVLGQQGDQAAPADPNSAPPTIPVRADGSFDFAALTEHMKQIKAHEAFREQSKVILGADADVPYESLVGTMDAVRETKDRKLLFPDVTLAAVQ